MKVKLLVKLLCLALLLCWRSAAAPPEPAKEYPRHIMPNGYYVRESEDQEWHIAVSGKIPSLCGIYLIVYDKSGKVVHHGVVPHGDYGAESPFRVTVPKDGVAGDYKIKIIGNQPTTWESNLPLKRLKGGLLRHRHVLGTRPRPWRQGLCPVPNAARAGRAGFACVQGHLVVKDESGAVVADTRKGQYGVTRPGSPTATALCHHENRPLALRTGSSRRASISAARRACMSCSSRTDGSIPTRSLRISNGGNWRDFDDYPFIVDLPFVAAGVGGGGFRGVRQAHRLAAG